uniref:Homeobox domain-containing protein n=1 Tax=Nothobranchius furzeri TaxID=105023 RepID=A0A8C6KZ93_NOTFU
LYLQLDKDPAMYPHQNPVTRHPSLSLSPQNFPVPGPPQYSDFPAYHHHPGLSVEPHQGQQTGPGPGGWSPVYPPPPPPTRDDWSSHPYGTGGAPTGPGISGGPIPFSPQEFPGQPVGLPGPLSPGSPRRRNPYDWIRTSFLLVSDGKTRTKDKYRVVYTDHQRLELEKEFHYSKYITIRRKAELASALSLSERQVKIWFQNRRAKERKINKKKLQQPASSTTTPPTSSTGGPHGNSSSSIAMVTSSSGNNGLVSPSLALNIKEEY